jgi:signal transduction histidine kinase
VKDRFRPPVTGPPAGGDRPPSPETSERGYESLRRYPERGYVAGVAAGLSTRLGIDATLIRAAFVIALLAGGLGIPLYAAGWLLIQPEGPEKPIVGRLLTRSDTWLVAAGIGLIWRQSQAAPSEPRPEQRAALPQASLNRVGVGVALVLGGALIFLWLNDMLAAAGDVILPVVVILVAAAIILAPWWLRLVRSVASERAARIRSQERAEVAAHLHDSVLQTLALVQKRADDPAAVAALARRQERELRAWLNNTRPAGTATVAGALESAAAEVEGDHQVPIEVVTVGDGPLDERAIALVAAAREALVNASKFAGPEPISLFLEVEGERLEVFIRDRGPGFAVDDVPNDRRGVRDSIVGRMERHGGRATVHSTPGVGTEVELVMEP